MHPLDIKRRGCTVKGRIVFWTLVLSLVSSSAFAQPVAGAVNKADTVWVLLCAALVLLMTPGLALFYGGMVREKNVLNTLMMNIVCMGIITLQWVVIGYSLSFGKGFGGVVGSLEHAFFNHVGLNPSPSYASTVPILAFALFQMMFAIITPALISGAVVERMKFSAYLAFILLWATLVYDPICYWVWNQNGWLYKLGALDFAGGTVVHINAGISALVAAFILGKRKGFMKESILPHNITLTVIGTGLLWFGWFGFNAGSALAAGKLSTLAFATTHIASATAAFVWILLEYMKYKTPSTIGFCSGAVAGLVAITPAAGFVGIKGAMAIGAGAGAICFYTVTLKHKFGYDDALDVFGVHGIGGLWGAVATGIFASVGAKGLLLGDFAQFGKQILACAITLIYAGLLTFAILKAIDAVIGLRVSEEAEISGLDLELHGEKGYRIW